MSILKVRLNDWRIWSITATVSILGWIVFQQMSDAVVVPPSDSTGSLEFAFNLAKASLRTEQENILLSPFGAYHLLSLTSNGAEGDTRTEMLQMLGNGKNSIAALNIKNVTDVSQMTVVKQNHRTTKNNASPDRLEIANAIFLNGLSLLPSFTKIADRYEVRANSLNFGDKQALSTVNGWVKERTGGLISKLFDELDPDASVILINALYFKGTWLSKFAPEGTRAEAFHLPNGKTKFVNMMHAIESYKFASEKNFEVIALPYQDRRQSLIVLLPTRDFGTAKLVKAMNAGFWRNILKDLKDQEVNVSFPRFKMETDTELIPILESLGMRLAFSAKADFSAMSERHLSITKAFQKTYLRVNEQGTEAGAATALSMSEGFRSVPETQFVADRPFVIVLRNDVTESILFLGLVNDPTE